MRDIGGLITHNIELNSRTIYISGEVNDEMLECVCNGLVGLGISKPILLVLNSGGGDLATAWSIYDLIYNYPCEVNIVVIGQCCSAATIILQAGYRRFITPNSYLMIHSGHFEEQPKLPPETRKNWRRLAKYHTDKMVEMYSNLMGITPYRVKNLIKHDQIYVGEEAVKMNFCDAVW